MPLKAVARGVGEFRKTDVATRIKAAQLLLNYAYHMSLPTKEGVDEEPRIQWVKRIILDGDVIDRIQSDGV